MTTFFEANRKSNKTLVENDKKRFSALRAAKAIKRAALREEAKVRLLAKLGRKALQEATEFKIQKLKEEVSVDPIEAFLKKSKNFRTALLAFEAAKKAVLHHKKKVLRLVKLERRLKRQKLEKKRAIWENILKWESAAKAAKEKRLAKEAQEAKNFAEYEAWRIAYEAANPEEEDPLYVKRVAWNKKKPKIITKSRRNSREFWKKYWKKINKKKWKRLKRKNKRKSKGKTRGKYWRKLKAKFEAKAKAKAEAKAKARAKAKRKTKRKTTKIRSPRKRYWIWAKKKHAKIASRTPKEEYLHGYNRSLVAKKWAKIRRARAKKEENKKNAINKKVKLWRQAAGWRKKKLEDEIRKRSLRFKELKKEHYDSVEQRRERKLERRLKRRKKVWRPSTKKLVESWFKLTLARPQPNLKQSQRWIRKYNFEKNYYSDVFYRRHLRPLIFKQTLDGEYLRLSTVEQAFIQKHPRSFEKMEVELVNNAGRPRNFAELHKKSPERVSTTKRRESFILRRYEYLFFRRQNLDATARRKNVNPISIILPGQGYLSFQTTAALFAAIEDEIYDVESARIALDYKFWARRPGTTPRPSPAYNKAQIITLAWRRVRGRIFAPLLPRYNEIRAPFFKKLLKNKPLVFNSIFDPASFSRHPLLSSEVSGASKITLCYHKRKQDKRPFTNYWRLSQRRLSPHRRDLLTTLALSKNINRFFPKNAKKFKNIYRRIKKFESKRARLLKELDKIPVKDPSRFISYQMRKRTWRNVRRKRKPEYRRPRWLGDRRGGSRRLRWPRVFPQKRHYRQDNWKARRASRKRGEIGIAQTFFRSRTGLRKEGSAAQKIFIAGRRIKRENLKKLISYYSVNYALKPRKWHTPRDVNGEPLLPVELSEVVKSKRILEKDLRFYEKQRLLREARSEPNKKIRQDLFYQAKAKNLQPPKFRDYTWRDLELRTGYPATLGYRYQRRTYRNNFITNRWWQPVTEATRVLHPFALVPKEQQPKIFLNHPNHFYYHTDLETRPKTLWKALDRKLSLTPPPELKSSIVFAAWEDEVYRIREYPFIIDEKRSLTWQKYFTLVKGKHQQEKSLYSAISTDTPYWICTRPEEAIIDVKEEEYYQIIVKRGKTKNYSDQYMKECYLALDAWGVKAREYSRVQLFQTCPDWWAKEARLRLRSLQGVIKRFNSFLFKRTIRRLRSSSKKRLKKLKAIYLMAKLLHLPENWLLPQLKNFLTTRRLRFSKKQTAEETKLRSYRRNRKKSRLCISQSAFCEIYYSDIDRLRARDALTEKAEHKAALICGEDLKKRDIARFIEGKNYVTDITPTLKENGTAHQRWAEIRKRKAKDTLSQISSYNHALEISPTIYQLPFENPRFPATANRSLSYARAVRTFYNKTITPRLRIINDTNSRKIVPTKLRDKKVFSVHYQRNAILRSKRRALAKFSSHSYLSQNARVSARAKVYPGPSAFPRVVNLVPNTQKSVVKRRFARSPIALRESETKLEELAHRGQRRKGHSVYLAGVLKNAIKRRSKLRVVTEKKKLIRQRITIAEQALPSWRRRREARQRQNKKKIAKMARREAKQMRVRSNSWRRSFSRVFLNQRDHSPESVPLINTNGRALTEVTNIERIDWAQHGYNRQSSSRRNYANTLTLGRASRRKKHKDLITVNYFEPNKKGKYKSLVNSWRRRKNRKKSFFVRRAWIQHEDIEFCVEHGERCFLRVERNEKFALEKRAKNNQYEETTCGKEAFFRSTVDRSKRFSIKKYPLRPIDLAEGKTTKKPWPPSWFAGYPQDSFRFFAEANPKPRWLKYLHIQDFGPRVKRLKIKKSGRSQFQFKSLSSGIRLSAKIAKLERKRSPKKTVGTRILEGISSPAKISPLAFYPHRREIIDIAALTKKDKDFQIATTQSLYRVTGEIAACTTQLFSHLISWLRKYRGSGSGRSSEDAEKLVSATYWNLRVCLSQDFFGLRLWAKDNSLLRREDLKNEIHEKSETRPSTPTHTQTRRKRRQASQVTRKEPQRAASLRWLRHWFPRLYKFHLESPETFEDLTFTRTEARRSKPCSDAFEKWETQDIAGNAEAAFSRRVLAEKGKNTARYETRLRTARQREAVDRCKGLRKQVFSSFISLPRIVRPHFFAKGYSTNSYHRNPPLSLLRNRSFQQNRNTALSDNERPQQHLIRIYPQRKTRLNRRPLYDAALRRDEPVSGRIDPRATRQKSPRNALYWQRRPAEFVENQAFARAKSFASLLPSVNSEEINKEERLQIAATTRIIYDWKKGWKAPKKNDCDHQEKLFRSPWVSSKVSPDKLSQLRQRRAQSRKISAAVLANVEKPYEHLKIILPFNGPYRRMETKYNSSIKTEKIIDIPDQRHSSSTADHSKAFLYEAKVPWDRKIHLNIVVSERRRSVLESRVKVKAYGFGPRFNPGKSYPWIKNEKKQYLLGFLPPSKSLAITESPQTSSEALALRTKNLPRYNSREVLPLAEKLIKQPIVGCFDFYITLSRSITVYLTDKYYTRLAKADVNILNIKRAEFWAKLTTKHYLKARLVKTWVKDRKRILIRINWEHIPEIIFKERRARLRRFEWHESDRYFFRTGWKYAFNLNPEERERAPWFEPRRRRRTAYSTHHGEYRRYSFPREQKRLKTLQYYRKARVSREPHRLYVKWRRWPRIRTTAYRRYRSFFEFRNTRTAQKHFKKLSKQTPENTGFSRNSVGTRNRLDVVLHLLGITKTVFWGRLIASFGIIKINGKKISKANHRLQPGDILVFDWGKIRRLKAEFTVEKHWSKREDTVPFYKLPFRPGNFSWRHNHNFLSYDRLPTPDDLVKNTRIVQWRFDSFRRDAGIGRR